MFGRQRSLLSPLRISFILFITAGGALFAQTSPWPFPPRSTGPAPAQRGGSGLTVAFWNIEWFPGTKPEPTKAEEQSQIAAVHAEMKKIDADIIGMEEVRDWDSAALAVQPLAGFKVDVCAKFPSREGQDHAQEVTIASRLQPLSAWAEEWKPASPVSPPRGFA